MENTNKISKVLITVVLLSYLFIVLPLEKWNLFLGQVILLSPLGLPYFPDIIYFPFGFLSVILTAWVLISRKPLTSNRNNLIRLNVVSYYIPLVVYHCIEPFSIRRYDTWFFIIPEIVFIILSVVLFMQTFARPLKKQPLLA